MTIAKNHRRPMRTIRASNAPVPTSRRLTTVSFRPEALVATVTWFPTDRYPRSQLRRPSLRSEVPRTSRACWPEYELVTRRGLPQLESLGPLSHPCCELERRRKV